MYTTKDAYFAIRLLHCGHAGRRAYVETKQVKHVWHSSQNTHNRSICMWYRRAAPLSDRTDKCIYSQGPVIGEGGKEVTADSIFFKDMGTRGRYHGGRRPSRDESLHSPTVIPPRALDKPSIMKPYHRRRTCSHISPRRSQTIARLHDTRFVECPWWKDGWTVHKTVVYALQSLAKLLLASCSLAAQFVDCTVC